MTTRIRLYGFTITVFAVLVLNGCKQQNPYAHLHGDNRYTFYYNNGTYFSLGIPTGVDIRVKSEEYGIAADKNCGTISTVMKTGPKEYVSLLSGYKEDFSEESSILKKQNCTGNIWLDILHNLEISEKE